MRILNIKIYTIIDHPNQEKCFEWIRNNWNDLNEHSVNQVIESIKALNKIIGGNLLYLIGQNSERGEHITFTDYDKELLNDLSGDDLPLTGVCWDKEVIDGLKANDLSTVLKWLHKETEYIYSNEGLIELCISNEYEFYENGDVFNSKK